MRTTDDTAEQRRERKLTALNYLDAKICARHDRRARIYLRVNIVLFAACAFVTGTIAGMALVVQA